MRKIDRQFKGSMGVPSLVGIAGVSTVGKDTLYRRLAYRLTKKGFSSSRMAISSGIRSDIQEHVKKFFNISIFTSSKEEKKIIRPLMEAHGCVMRKIKGGDYWIRQMSDMISFKQALNSVVFVTDIRHAEEAGWVVKNGGVLIHLQRWGEDGIVRPFSKFEEDNDPFLQEMADYSIVINNSEEPSCKVEEILEMLLSDGTGKEKI
jgi:hypothetical protein